MANQCKIISRLNPKLEIITLLYPNIAEMLKLSPQLTRNFEIIILVDPNTAESPTIITHLDLRIADPEISKPAPTETVFSYFMTYTRGHT